MEEKFLKLTIILLAGFAFYACGTNEPPAEKPVSQATSPQAQQPNITDVAAKAPEPTPVAGEPSNVMEFFAALPDKYFTLEGCDRGTDKDCKKARAEYLKTFTEVSDIKNGYFKGGCDGAQSCIEMAIFKRPDGRYLVGVYVSHELIDKNYFLDYENGSWKDVSTAVVPGFSNKNLYELPREGTTVKVFAKIITEQGDDYEISEKGKKLYDLVWKDGKFTKK